MTLNRLLLLAWTIWICLVPAAAQVTVKFLDSDTNIKATEGGQFTLRIKRTGEITAILNVVVSVSRNLGKLISP